MENRGKEICWGVLKVQICPVSSLTLSTTPHLKKSDLTKSFFLLNFCTIFSFSQDNFFFRQLWHSSLMTPQKLGSEHLNQVLCNTCLYPGGSRARLDEARMQGTEV